MWTAKQVAERLNIQESGVKRLPIPQYQISKRLIRWDEKDVERYARMKPQQLPQLLDKTNILSAAIGVHNFPCIYFLIRADEIVYVGQTRNLSKRLGRHLESGKIFDSYHFIRCQQDELLALEYAYISSFKPLDNIMCNIADEPVPSA